MESTTSPLIKPTSRSPWNLAGLGPWIRRLQAREALAFEPSLSGAGELLRVHGRLTQKSAVRFKQAVRQALERTTCITLDLAGVTRLDPTGLAALAEVSEWARARGARVLVMNLGQPERDRLARASLHKVIEFANP
jgi:anti-anti-sigma factor